VRESVVAIIVAAGSGSRFGADKLLAPLSGRPLLRHTLDAIAACGAVDDTILVVSPERVDEFGALVRDWGIAKVRQVCAGGARRQDSVFNGLQETDAIWVVVHDGARPLVTPALIDRCLLAAAETGAAICGVPVADTLKAVTVDGLVQHTVRRAELWAAQTPQVFRRDLLSAAHELVVEDVTDDAALLERIGHPIRMVEGASWNLKVTQPDDLALAHAVLWERGTGAVGSGETW
jgi:2-C-methyl-D-erythritol 4-phosphate cytidylyltransferase